MKVLYVIDTLEIGGAERSLLEITSRLKRSTPIVCQLYAGDALRAFFEAQQIPVVSFNIRAKYGFIPAYQQLKQLVRKEKPDLIVSALYRSEIISRLVARSERIPQIGSIVSDTYSKEKKATLSTQARLLFNFFYWINRATAGISAAFIANSKTIANSVGSSLRIPSSKIHVIYRGRRVPSVWPSRPAGRQKFLCVGRLIPSKGHDLILEAFAAVAKQFPGTTLSFAGDGPDRSRLENLVTKLSAGNRVIFLGQCDSMDEVYAEHDCLIFASRFEGFSGVIVEAMMAGVPVIASDIPMNQEAIDHGKTGYLFRDGDVAELLQAITWFLNHRVAAETMAAAAVEEARRRFNIETVVEQHETLYHQTVSKVS